MPYVDPQTVNNPTAGAVAPAAWGDAVRDAVQFLANPPKVRVYNSASISHVTSGTSQALTFNSERYDTDTMHSTSVNTGRITFTTAGTYSLFANVEFASNATGYRALEIRLGGATIIASQVAQTNATQVTIMTIYTEYAFTAGQYVEIMVNQTSGAALNINAGANYSPEAGARWVSL
ncbi:MAG: hypothetical protein M3Q98_04600 [Actinomycetota bacterium]|nr:hypothetical protein [Actinomycetota bacterium]